MEQKISLVRSFIAIFLILILLLSGCAAVVDNSGMAFVSVEKGFNWKSVYQVGESISLEGLTLQYYSDISDESTRETVTLTENMITGFDTSSAGSFTMTVTYNGKSDTVDYTVVPKATPFEISKILCIAENTVVSIDSASMKATVSVFDSYFKALEDQPSRREEKTVSYRVDGEGDTYASFEYNGSRYDIFYDAAADRYQILTVSSSSTSSSSTQQIAHPFSPETMSAPQKNTQYKSTLKDNVYYSITVDDAYNAVVTKHTHEGGAVTDTVVDTFAATDAVLTVNGGFRYSLRKDGYLSTAVLTQEGQFKIRKTADTALESIYSETCAIAP